MAGEFQTINLTAVDEQLRIGVSDGGRDIDGQLITFFHVSPPITDGEYIKLLEQEGPETDVSNLLQGSIEKDGEWSRFSADGEPGEEHVNLGVKFAEKLIELRGISSGKVVAAVGETATEFLVMTK